MFQTIVRVASLPSLFCVMEGVKICKKINLRLIMPEHRVLLHSQGRCFVYRAIWSKNQDTKLRDGVRVTLHLKADSHITCRAHALPLPCRTVKGLEYVFPFWFTQCGRVWFTLAMPCPCHAPTMPFFSRPRHSTAVERRPVVYLPAFCFFWLPRGVPRRTIKISDAGGQCETKQRLSWTRKRVVAAHNKKGDLLNCWTSSSDISGYNADFHEGHDTVGAEQRRGMACVN